uniref:Uncharacterized protein n=1 Tax=viral metagenome TaxID=1070528 RepID=A0A6M3LGH5_9ZZZZ
MIDKSKISIQTIKTAGEDIQIERLSELTFYAPAVHGNYKMQAVCMVAIVLNWRKKIVMRRIALLLAGSIPARLHNMAGCFKKGRDKRRSIGQNLLMEKNETHYFNIHTKQWTEIDKTVPNRKTLRAIKKANKLELKLCKLVAEYRRLVVSHTSAEVCSKSS